MSGFLISCSQEGEKKPEYKYEYATVENDPMKTLIYTLDNGLKVYMSVNNNEPRIFTNIAVRTGSKQDPADATGLAHYLEHMMFKGTSNIGAQDWETEKVLLQQISDLYEEHRNTTDIEERKALYHQIDSVSGIAATYVVANEYDKMISSIGAKSTNAYTSVEQTVYVNDIRHLWTVFLFSLLFTSPIFWRLEDVNGILLQIHQINPLGQLIEITHKLVINGQIPALHEWLYASSFVFAILLIGYAVFRKFEKRIVEEL